MTDVVDPVVRASVQPAHPSYADFESLDGPVQGAIRNPWNPRAAYVFEPDLGTVRVTMGRRWGRFTVFGKHVEGPLFEADPELCIWMSRERPKNHHRTSHVAGDAGASADH